MTSPHPLPKTAVVTRVAEAVRQALWPVGVSAALALVPCTGHALGFGKTELRSALGQPLDARVPLVLGPDELAHLDALTAEIPDVWEHDAAGMTPVGARNVTPRVVPTPGGGAEIRLSSDRAMNEPALNFLLRVTGPDGSATGELSVILDHPGRAPVPVAGRPQESPSRARPAPATVLTADPGSLPAGRYLVRPGQTLYQVLREHYPQLLARAGEAGQAMVARNPHAFIGGDPARLIAGASLHLPPAAELLSASPAAGDPLPWSGAGPDSTGSRTEVRSWTDYGPVRSGENLYRIALRYTDPGSVAPLMRAIVDANPHAFVDGDMHRMLSGVSLRVPAHPLPGRADPAPGVPAAPATARVAGPAAPQASALPSPAAASPAAAPGGSVSGGDAASPSMPGPAAAAATASAPATSAPAAPAAGNALAGIQAQIAAARDGAQAQRQQQAALEARLAEIDARIRSLSARTIDQDRELSALRSRLSTAVRDAVSPVPDITLPQVSAPPAPVAGEAEGPEPAATAAARDRAPPVAAPRRARETAGVAPAPSLFESIRFYVLGALALVVLGAGGFLAYRRFKRPAVEEHTDYRDFNSQAARERIAELRERFLEDASAFDDPDASMENIVPLHLARAGRFAEEAVSAFSSGEMAQAETLISQALAVDPDRLEYKELLACVYDATNRELEANILRSEISEATGDFTGKELTA